MVYLADSWINISIICIQITLVLDTMFNFRLLIEFSLIRIYCKSVITINFSLVLQYHVNVSILIILYKIPHCSSQVFYI